MSNYSSLSKSILDSIGGKENISLLTHCMTRLRFNFKDESIIDVPALKNITGVLGVVTSGGQLQLVIGQHVEKVYNQLCKDTGIESGVPLNVGVEKKKFEIKTLPSKVLDALAGCLTPLIPMLIAASMFKMLVAVLGPDMLQVLSVESDLYRLFALVGDAGFYFFPILVAYTAARKFNATPVLAMFVGAIMLHPTLIEIVGAGEAFSIYGLSLYPVTYASSILPIILSVYVMSYIEAFLKKIVPQVLKSIFVPTLTILAMLPIALSVVGPLGFILGEYIVKGILSFGELGVVSNILVIALIGALWQFLVMTGMHLLMITTLITVFFSVGSEGLVSPGAISASMAVSGMALGLLLRIKNKEAKSLSFGYLVAAFIGGVTEPALYGIGVKYKRPFIGLMVGGFAGALYGAVMGVKAYALVPVASFLALTGYAGGPSSNLLHGVISGVIALGVAAIVTYSIGVNEAK